MQYGREPKGTPWYAKSILDMMVSETALGYLMHEGRPVTREVIDPQTGEKHLEKVRIAPRLWDAGTRAALIAKLKPKRSSGRRVPKLGGQLMTARAVCGNCDQRLYLSGRREDGMAWGCTGRVNGLPQCAHCKPAPSIGVAKLDAMVTAYFLENFGDEPQYRQVFDPGTGHGARRAELEGDLTRLREDRQAGIYDRPADAAWFRTEYARMSQELDALSAEPEREAGMVWVPTGKTIGQLWAQAGSDAERRELLASYHVKAVIYPRSSGRHVWIHSLDPAVEADARRASWEAAQREQDAAFFARLQAEQENEPDWDDYHAQQAADEAARDQADQDDDGADDVIGYDDQDEPYELAA